MTLTELTLAANVYTDENFNAATTRAYANEAIARANIALKAKLPYFSDTDDNADYTALDEMWLRTYVVPYIAYSIKMNDGSLNEADRFNVRWQEALYSLRREKQTAIAEAYQGTGFKNGYKIEQHSWMGSAPTSSFRDIYKGD